MMRVESKDRHVIFGARPPLCEIGPPTQLFLTPIPPSLSFADLLEIKASLILTRGLSSVRGVYAKNTTD